MTVPRLTVIGHCTSTTARILCAVDRMPAAQRRSARLAWRSAGAAALVEVELANAPPYELAVFDLRDLPPGAEIEYGIAVGEAPAAERILASGTRRFRLLPANRPTRVALLSCNGVYEIKDHAHRYDMWRRLHQQITGGNVDLVIHAGDQVYADDVVKRYTRMARTAKNGEALLATLTEEYRRLYVERFWTMPDVAAVLTSCPNLMTWDDHDIDEGWGSNPRDNQPWRRLFFRAARQAFSEFQASIGCPRIDEDSFACGFVHGELAFLLLDGRSHRLYSEGRVLGAAQFDAARRWLAALSSSTRRVYLVLGIPPVHAKLATAAAILRWTPFTEPYASDLRDGWASKGNRAECERLMQLMVEFCRAHPATDITVLSGDVHVADIGRLEHKEVGVLWQVTSSGIGSPPPEGLSGWLMENVSRPAVDLGAGVRGKLVPITEHGHDLMHRRNFALLEVGDRDGWHAEGACGCAFSAKAWPSRANSCCQAAFAARPRIAARVAPVSEDTLQRCAWATTPLGIAYHDTEWGMPVHEERVLFEFLILEGAQAGLSWETILRKRDAYRRAFEGFDPARVARFTPAAVRRLMKDEGIVRNRLKIESAVSNAKAFLAVQREFGSFDAYVWRFVGGKPIVNRRRRTGDVPATSEQSDALSKDLLKRGFKFVGSTICYAFMQAVGMVDDHLDACFRKRRA